MNRATFEATYEGVGVGAQFPDNTTRLISELRLRTFAGVISDNFLMIEDDYNYYIKGTTASGTDTYTITEIIPATYTSGERFLITFTNANTGAATLNRNNLGAKDLLNQSGVSLTAGEIVSGGTYLVRYNGTNYRILNQASSALIDIDASYQIKEDFLGATFTHFLVAGTFNNGGGLGVTAASSTFGVDNTEKASGVVQLATGASTAGGSSLSSTTFQLTFGFGFEYNLIMRCALSALSDGTDTYSARIGFMDANDTIANILDGAYFRYTHGTNSGKWQAVTVSNGTETAEDTGIAADTVFNTFKIIANSGATQIDFYINGVKTNDITTNIINSSARLTGEIMTIEKQAGSTSRLLYCDYITLSHTRSSSR